jgi:protein-disulfide isomerase
MTNAARTVRVIAYEDLQCSDCAAYARMLEERLLPRYAQVVEFVRRDFPLPKHTWARPAAMVARHFDGVTLELGGAFRRYCYDYQQEIDNEGLQAHIRNFAVAHNTEPDRAVTASTDPDLAQPIDLDYREGISRGVVRTPTVFVNDEAFIERFSFHDIARSIESALQSTGASFK